MGMCVDKLSTILTTTNLQVLKWTLFANQFQMILVIVQLTLFEIIELDAEILIFHLLQGGSLITRGLSQLQQLMLHWIITHDSMV